MVHLHGCQFSAPAKFSDDNDKVICCDERLAFWSIITVRLDDEGVRFRPTVLIYQIMFGASDVGALCFDQLNEIRQRDWIPSAPRRDDASQKRQDDGQDCVALRVVPRSG